MNFKGLTTVRDRVITAMMAEQKKIDALGPRRKKALAKLDKLERTLADMKLSTEVGDNIERDLEALRAERRTELGVALADGRKANTTKLDAAIKVREKEQMDNLEAIEAATYGAKEVEARIAKERAAFDQEEAECNKLASEGKKAMAELKHELAIAAYGYGINVSVSAGVDEVVGQHFDLIDHKDHHMRYYSSIHVAAINLFKNSEYHGHADPLRDLDMIREMRADELQRLADLGLPENTKRRPAPYSGPVQYAPGYQPRPHGIYDAAGRQVG